MSAPADYGSLDDLVDATLADFALWGVDSLTKVSLLEAAWKRAMPAETPDAYALCLGGGETPEAVRFHLEQLAAAGLLLRDGDCFRLNESAPQRLLLARLQAFWSDRELHARAAPLLRYRMA